MPPPGAGPAPGPGGPPVFQPPEAQQPNMPNLPPGSPEAAQAAFDKVS